MVGGGGPAGEEVGRIESDEGFEGEERERVVGESKGEKTERGEEVEAAESSEGHR